MVSNGNGAATSALATVTVLPGGIPSITVQPQDQYRLPGRHANFAVVAEGSPPLSYEWRKNGLSIPGETNSSLLFFGVSLTNAGEYVAVVSNASGCVTSTIATLYISAAAAPTILTQIEPKRPTVLEGGTVSFTVSATGFPPPTYQWRTDGLVLPGATNNVLTLNNVQRSIGAFIINVIVSNEVGSVIASGASVAVVWPPQMFEISDVNAAEGAFIRISGGVSARPDPVYQWFKDGQPLSQAGVLTFSPIQSADAGVYFLRASNSLGWAESQPLKVRVVPQGPLDKWHLLGQFSPPVQAYPVNLVFAGNTFLVLGDGGYGVSTNGSTWVNGTGPNLFLLDTAFGNGLFVSVGWFAANCQFNRRTFMDGQECF